MTKATDEFRPWAEFSNSQRWLFLAVLFLISSASYADRQLLPVVLEAIKIEFHLSDGMLGALGGAPFALCFALSSIPFARAADSGNRKLWLIAAFALWTIMTAFCGLAPSLLFLFIARMGVGMGEGGALPVSHALIADYFPHSSRGKAFAIFSAAITVGSTVALIGGGWLTQYFGWRMAFVVMSLGSLPIGLLAIFILREPARPPFSGHKLSLGESFKHDMGALIGKRSFIFLMAGFTSYSLFAYGPLVFVPAFLMREMHLDIAVVGTAYGIANAIGTAIGSVVSGIFCDRLFARDPRWLLWWPAACFALAVPTAILAFSATSFSVFLFWIAVLPALQFAALTAIFSAVQYVCGPTRRATATALVLASINAIGLTMGPLATGFISDGLAASDYSQPLGHALMIMTVTLIPATILFIMASRTLVADAE